MADNPSVNGLPIAADQIPDDSGEYYQWIKLGYGGPNEFTSVKPATPMPVQLPGAVELLEDTASWANSAAAMTAVNKDLNLPGGVANPGRLLAVFVRNPSSETDLLCQIQWEWIDPSDDTTVRHASLSTPTGPSYFTVLQSDATGYNAGGQVFLVDGGLPALGGGLVLQNVSAVGGSGGFSASVRVFALCAV